jgi:hypothetical protein
LTWFSRLNADHPSLAASSAEECAGGRAEFAELPSIIEPFGHRCHEQALQVGAMSPL